MTAPRHALLGLLLPALALLASACGAGAGRGAAGPARPTEHPRVGQVWDVAAAHPLARDALVKRLADAQVVLLGETHDNPRHHLGQADLLGALLTAGRRPAVAFEMFETDQQEALDTAHIASPRDPDAVARALSWDRSGWPPFAMYRPIFETALRADLRLLAASLPKGEARAIVRQGLTGMDPARVTALGLDRPLPPEAQSALEQEMADSHCGMLPTEMLGGMVLAQRARDATMATVMAAAGEGGAVGIVGAGHARLDRGVPARLRAVAPSMSVLSIAWLEIAATDPPEVPADLPYDVVIFTTPEPREDPCAAFRH